MARDLDEERAQDASAVAETLEQIRAGVRQRQAELAALDAEVEDLPPALARVRQTHRLAEPAFEAEGRGARLLPLQKIFYHLFVRRHHQPLLRQQTEFNRSVDLALEELARRQKTLASSLEALSMRLESGAASRKGDEERSSD